MRLTRAALIKYNTTEKNI